MDQSWLSRASSSRRGLVAESKHERPRWRSPSPLTASVIPAPIVQSTYGSSQKPAAKSIYVGQPPRRDDRHRELEADLQFLLDAQSEALESVIQGRQIEEGVSTGSTTPTARSYRSTSAKPRPVRRRPGLRNARKGIWSTMVALSAVKNEELQGIDVEVQDKEQTLAQIDAWEKKREGLREAAANVDEHAETVRAQRLRQEAEVLGKEIHRVELQLADMKARHRKLMRQVAAAENSFQAKLAPYTSSINMLEADIQKFLSLDSEDTGARSQHEDGKTSMWQLPPKRRTLEMARQHWKEDREAVLQQRASIEREKQALDEGAMMWKDVAAQLQHYERQVAAAMVVRSTVQSNSAWEEPDATSSTDGLLAEVNAVIESLQTQHDIAQARHWNLLIAAIGAELNALRQAKQLFAGDAKASGGESEDLVDTAEDSHGPLEPSAGHEIHELDKSFETARRRGTSNGNSDTDDEPDPELLFSRQETDTE